MPVCERCGATGGEWVVRRGANLARRSREGIVEDLKAGRLDPADFVSRPGAGFEPIGAHPDFRPLFMPGTPEWLGLSPPRSSRGWWPFARAEEEVDPTTLPKPVMGPPPPRPARPRSMRRALTALLAVALAGAAWTERERLLPLMEELRTRATDLASQVQKDVQKAVEPPPVEVPPPASKKLDTLLAGGTSEEPVALLLARGWSARMKGTGAGLTDAVGLALDALRRAPDDAEALATFAEWAAEGGVYAEERAEALAKAVALAPADPAVLRASIAAALAEEGLGTSAAPEPLAQDHAARRAARWCAEVADRAAPGNLGCRYHALRIEAADAAAWDALGTAWPPHRGIPRAAALAAARDGAPDAVKRLEKVVGADRQDPETGAALAALYLDGDRVDAATRVLAGLGPSAPPPLTLRLGRSLLRSGDGEGTARLLAGLVDTKGDPKVLRDLRTTYAQALWLRASRDRTPANLEAAYEAANRAAELGAAHPATAQVRMLAAVAVGQAAKAERAWDLADRDLVSGWDLARLHLTRAEIDVAGGGAREALASVEAARTADFRLPETHLWVARIGVARADPGRVFEGLRRAVRDVDGSAAERPPWGELLPLPVDTAAIQRDLAALVAHDARAADDLVFAEAALAWLSGDLGGARKTLAQLLNRDADQTARALAARLALASGDAAGALGEVDRVIVADPREPAWHLLRAQALVRLGRHDEAAQALAIVKNAGAGSAEAFLVEAALLEHRGDTAGALVAAKGAVAADPSHRSAAALYARLSPQER